jgi:hypothetical protein
LLMNGGKWLQHSPLRTPTFELMAFGLPAVTAVKSESRQ